MSLAPGIRLGSYTVVELLGTGGMGEVYRAHDDRLARDVAIKIVKAAAASGAPSRVWREARAAASVNHPGVCQIYEIGEKDEQIFIAMELLDGGSLAARIAHGPIDVNETAVIARAILGALEALHQHGIVHRDLKPSNVFLTSHGVKLLDFGIAHRTKSDADTTLLATGTITGTPEYMAPEQWTGGQTPDLRTDLFALGAIMFEMLVGRRAFPGTTLAEIHHAVMSTQPPALAGSPAVAAVDGVIHRALEKRPHDRYAGAAAMAEALQAALSGADPLLAAPARPTTRIIVLPFRMLRPDPDVDFLAFSLPDAVTASLAGLESLVIRSTLTGAAFTDAMDLHRIASELGVDAVVCGTLLRAGGQVRVSAQLVEAPSGTILWSKTVQTALRDIFQVQDELAAAIVESLAIPLSSREQRQMRRDLPTSARAYEFYLRANQIGIDATMLPVARDLYRSALDDDPSYAPAWARLGRVYRVLAKYGGEDPAEHLRLAEAAFGRALDLNPDLGLAHNLYTAFEVESLGRPRAAMTRLLERAKSRTADPDLFTGLVLACRYCGLLGASIAADRQARRLDPGIRTSVMYTYFMRGDWERAIAADNETVRFTTVYALPMIGRSAEAIALSLQTEARPLPPIMHLLLKMGRSGAEQNRAECVELNRQLSSRATTMDPEALYFGARSLSRVGDAALALDLLEQVVEKGFHCAPALRRDPWLAPLHGDGRFERIVERAEAQSRDAEAAYRELGGERLLGPANAEEP